MTADMHDKIDDDELDKRLRAMYTAVMPLLDRRSHAAVNMTAADTDPAADVVLEDRTPARSRHRGGLAAGLVISVAAIAAIVALAHRNPDEHPAVDTDVVTTGQLTTPQTIASTIPSASSPLSATAATGLVGAAITTSLPDTLTVWGIILGDGTSPFSRVPGYYSQVDVAANNNPFRYMVGITAGPAPHETLPQRRDRLAQQDQQHVPAGYHSTFEIVAIGGVDRLVTTTTNGFRIVDWIDQGRLMSVSDSGAVNGRPLTNAEMNQVVTGVTFVDVNTAHAVQRQVSDRLAATPLVTSAVLDGETIEYHALADSGARSLCISDTNSAPQCRLLVSEADLAGNPITGDVIIDLSTDDGGSRTYGWIAAPALLTASNTTTPITQEVIGDQTWFRIDVPDGAGSDITVHHERETHGEFSLGWTVGLPQPSGDAERSKTQPT